ncbi:MAG TPA: DUF1269 domain-containing protein, partial [Acidimicrobiales bacterium]
MARWGEPPRTNFSRTNFSRTNLSRTNLSRTNLSRTNLPQQSEPHMSRAEASRSGTLVGISFDSLFRAQEFLIAAQGLAASGKLVLNDAVIVIKNDEGHALVHETIDPTPGRSAAGGAFWVSLLGLALGGPIGWAAGAAIGAGAGAVAAKVVDLGISDEWVAWFREAVQPGTATVALLADDIERNALVAEVSRFPGAEVVYSNLDADTLARIHDVLGDDRQVPDAATDESTDQPAGERSSTAAPTVLPY